MNETEEKGQEVVFDDPTARETTEEDVSPYPGPLKLTIILIALGFAVFLYGLDSTIIATAIPRITDDFHALGDVGWYAASYLLTSSAFQLVWGKLYTVFSVKVVYLSAIGLFELGSLVCAVAPISAAFIVGRAFAGVGAAGLYSGSIIMLTYIAPLNKRPAYTGLLGAAVGISSIVGPFLGGIFADQVTWRWCFYINLPIGAVTAAIVLFTVSVPRNPEYEAMTWLRQLAQLDTLGIFTLVPAITCLLLALDWGGQTYAWSNVRIIILFILAGLLAISFVLVQCYTPATRSITSSIFKSRSIAFMTWYACCMFSLFVVMTYYLPIFFQGVQQVDAFESGVRIMPVIIGFIVMVVLSGLGTSSTGYYTPFMIASSIITPIGLGLLTTLNPESPNSHWIGYQALFGFGIGTGIQQPLMVIQTVLPDVEIPIGTCLVTLSQSLGGAVFVAIAQSIFQNRLSENVGSTFPSIDPRTLLSSEGATTVTSNLPSDARPAFLDAYSLSLTQTWYLAVALGAVSIVGALGTEWKSVKQSK